MQMLTPIERDLRTAPPAADSALAARAPFAARHALALAMLLVLPIAAQSPGVPSGSPVNRSRQQQQQDQPDSSPMSSSLDARRITQLNLIRQKNMASDAEKLLRIARELSNDANADSSALSPAERMHKAAEIEKLAKGVREKMTYAIGISSDPANPFSIVSR
jgi:hypothetical protein